MVIQVPRRSQDGETEECALTQSGDCAAAHAGGAIDSPVNRKGCCFRCLLRKPDWIVAGKCATACKRNFVYQCVANHINPYPFLPGTDSNGVPYAERAPPVCPHYGKTVDATLSASEKREYDEASPAGQADILRKHSSDHAGGMRGRVPIAPMDNRCRSRGVLHRRMNVTSNCRAATFLAVVFCAKKRQAANALLEKAKLIWRMPETAKKRAKTISAGNDSRRLLSDGELLKGLFKIFYGDTEEQQQQLDSLAAAATANDGVRQEQPGARASSSSSAPTRKAAAGVQGGGVAKKRGGGSTKKKKVVAVVAPKGKKVDAEDIARYSRKRRAAAAESSSPAPAADAPAAAKPADATGDAQKDGTDEDSSLEADEEEMEALEEDEKAGTMETAIDVWLTAIRYMRDLHSTVDDPFNDAQVKAHAQKVGRTGRLWAISINEHTSNRALWQYVHDAFAHVEEDILEHGSGDRNDDAILEKANRRKKRLGDRCTFRGGTNCPGAKFKQPVRVKVRDEKGAWTGRYVTKMKSRKANLGLAAQVQKLDLVAQICEAKRASARDALSVGEVAMKAEEKKARGEKRDTALKAVENFQVEMKAGGN